MIFLLLACDKGKEEDTSAEYIGPELSHTPPDATLAGSDLGFSVEATDPEGVLGVTLYWKSSIQGWTPINMSPDGSTYTTTLPGEDVVAPTIEYYFKATDAGSPAASSYLPIETDSAPFSVAISIDGQGLPYYQGFEEVSSLVEAGWHAASQGPRGYGWDISPDGVEGEQGAWHPRGNADIGKLQDWMISPALDFSSLQNIQVTWQEKGVSAEDADHSLYIGVADSDPTDGSFTLVNTVPAPGEDWGRSQVYDLSAWAGNTEVYLAWFAQSDNADDWYIDNIAVEELGADIVLSQSVTPAPLNPGDTGTLTVSLENTTTVGASDLTVTVSFPEGGASADGPQTVSVGGKGTETVDFGITIDASTQDNRYLPVHIEAAAGSQVWSYDGSILVGEESAAVIQFSPIGAGSLQLALGVGDPENPTWEEDIYASQLQTDLFLTLDVTDQWPYMAPAAGANRWYLRIDSESGGNLDEFTIHYDGVAYSAEPTSILLDGEVIVYLPAPPELEVISTQPLVELNPGDMGTAVNFNIRNTGNATSGPVTAELVSSEPDLTVTSGPASIGTINANQTVSTGYVFTVNVAATHLDSSPLEAELRLTDGIDNWSLPVFLPVPYPNLKITDITIDDDGGDGILDAGESATIEFSVSNVGDESCSGTVSGVLSAEATGSAVVTVDPDDDTLGTLSPGSTKKGQFDLTVDPISQPGDTVDLLLTMTDNLRNYEARVQLVLGEPPWRSLSPLDDDIGDTLGGSDFDVVNGQYRVVNGILQFRLSTDKPFDPATAFFEAWGISSGAPYSYYQIVLQSGIGSLRGYSNGFTDLGSATVSYPDATTAQLDVDLALLGLARDSLTIGIGAGWCGAPDYYCDHFPDYWGYPYDGLYTGDWFDMEW